MTRLLHAAIRWLLAAIEPADARDCICHDRARVRRIPPSGW